MTTHDDKVREQFEAHPAHAGMNFTRHTERRDQYANTTVQGRWATWQAALTAPQDAQERDKTLEEAASLCDGLAKLYPEQVGFDTGYTMAAKRAAEEIRKMRLTTAQPVEKPEGKAAIAQAGKEGE